MKSIAFHIVNDLLFAEMIVADATPTEVQNIVQERLNLDSRFRSNIVHLARPKEWLYPDTACCGQVGKTETTKDVSGVTCLKCLAGYGNSIEPTGISGEE